MPAMMPPGSWPASAEAAAAVASTRGLPQLDSRGIPAYDSWEEGEPDWGDVPGADGFLATAEDIVEHLDLDAQDFADEEDEETAIADAMADA